MKKYNMRINFIRDLCDGENDVWDCIIIVPDDVTIEKIKEELVKAHQYLDNEEANNEDDEWYSQDGRVPETLVQYVCEKHNWAYEEIKYDIDVEFD